jgi:hypothetical protein
MKMELLRQFNMKSAPKAKNSAEEAEPLPPNIQAAVDFANRQLQ